MKYEIKEISLTSLLKVSFLVGVTVFTVLFLFFTLLIGRLMKFIGDSIGNTSSLEVFQNLNLPAMIFGSLFNGILFSILLVFFLAICVILYNFFSKQVGGIELRLNKKSVNMNLENDKIELEEDNNS